MIELDAKARGIFILVKLYGVNSIFSTVSSTQKPPKFVPQVRKTKSYKALITEVKNCRIQPKENIYKPLFYSILPNFQHLKTPIYNTPFSASFANIYKLQTYSKHLHLILTSNFPYILNSLQRSTKVQ